MKQTIKLEKVFEINNSILSDRNVTIKKLGFDASSFKNSSRIYELDHIDYKGIESFEVSYKGCIAFKIVIHESETIYFIPTGEYRGVLIQTSRVAKQLNIDMLIARDLIQEEKIEAYVYENLHPQQKTVNDCVKRAFTKATGRDYKEISKELNEIKRGLKCKSYQNDKVWKSFVKKHEYEKYSFPAVKGEKRMNGRKFTISNSEGTYILNMAGHLSVCIDGVIYDTWDCRDKCVYTAFRVK